MAEANRSTVVRGFGSLLKGVTDFGISGDASWAERRKKVRLEHDSSTKNLIERRELASAAPTINRFAEATWRIGLLGKVLVGASLRMRRVVRRPDITNL